MAQVLGYPFSKSAVVTQTFAEHVARAKANGWCWQPGPCAGGVWYYGGIDFGVGVGTDVFVGMEGLVIRAGNDASGYGLHVRVQSGNYLLIYAHLSKVLVKAGEKVDNGQWIGVSGNTGNSTGPHLHLEVRVNGKPVDPWPLLHPGGGEDAPMPEGEAIFAGQVPAVAPMPFGRTLFVMNLRGGPSTDWPVVGQVPAKTDLVFTWFEVEGDENLWGCIGGYPSQWVAVAFANRWLVELLGVR